MAGIPRAQQDAVRQPAELLDGELAIDDGDDDAPVHRFEGTIHDEQIAIMDAEAGHRVSLHADEEGGFLMFDQVFVEAEARLEIVGGRGWKPGRHRTCQHRASGQGDAGRRQGKRGRWGMASPCGFDAGHDEGSMRVSGNSRWAVVRGIRGRKEDTDEHHRSERTFSCQPFLRFAVNGSGSHETVTQSGHPVWTYNAKENHSMECEDFLEPLQDQEYDDDL